MSSEEYKESDLSKIVKRLMDEEGFEFGEAVREAMEQTKNFESKADGGAIGIEILFGPKRENFRKGGDTIGGKNDKSKTSKGPDRSRVSAQQQSNHDRAMAAAQNNGGGGINNTINNINKTTVFDKAKNLANKVVDSPLTAFIDPRSKLALAMGGYKYLRDGVTPFQQKSIDEELEGIQTKGGIVPYADGGRAGYVSGGAALKLLEKGKEGIASLYSAGKGKFDEFVETMSQSKKPTELIDESIQVTKEMREGPITIKMLEDMNPDTVKKLLRSEEIGLYGSQRPEALIAADMIKRFTKADGTIDYERAEFILNRKLKGNESLDELLEIEFTTRPDKIPDQGLAEGGRVGLFMGGDPLTGQALSIYDSMKAYNFSDQEIANALSAQGLYTPGSTPVVDDPITNTAPNIINQGGGGDGPPKGPTFNRNDLLGTPDYFPAEPFSFKDTVSDIGEYIKSGGIIGTGIRGIKGLFSKNTKDYVTTPQLKARDRLEAERKAKEEAARQEVERQAAYAQAEKDRITYADLEKSIISGQGDGGMDRPDSGPTATGAGMGVDGGYASDYGYLKNGGRVGYKDGGLATLLNRRR
jgi:hypothetical protein